MTEPIYAVQEINYRYTGDVLALDNVTFTVERGMRVAIIGANGSGKSTLLRLLDGLYFPASGTIEVFGEPLTEERLQDDESAFRFRQRVGFVFQNPDVQLFNPTVFDEVAFGPLQLRWPKDEVRRRVDAALEMMEIAHLRHRSPHRLSGGEKKRVALASVLIMDPEVLLLDEPVAALDPKSQSNVIDFLVSWAGTGKTVITTTHDLDTLAEIADHCLVFNHGQLVAQDAPSAVLGNHELLMRTNLIHAHRHAHGPGKVHTHAHLHAGHAHVHPMSSSPED